MIDGQHPFTEDEVTGASGRQEGGSHYKDLGVEPWDVMAAWDREGFIGFLKFSALKRIARLGRKGGNSVSLDLRKASHELQKAAEIAELLEGGEFQDMERYMADSTPTPKPVLNDPVYYIPEPKMLYFSDIKEGTLFEANGEVYRKMGPAVAVRLIPGSSMVPDAEPEPFEDGPVSLVAEDGDV